MSYWYERILRGSSARGYSTNPPPLFLFFRNRPPLFSRTLPLARSVSRYFSSLPTTSFTCFFLFFFLILFLFFLFFFFFWKYHAHFVIYRERKIVSRAQSPTRIRARRRTDVIRRARLVITIAREEKIVSLLSTFSPRRFSSRSIRPASSRARRATSPFPVDRRFTLLARARWKASGLFPREA